MSAPITWTSAELKEFDRLVTHAESRDQAKRIEARIDLKSFIELHAKEKCDAMWAHLTAKEKKSR